MSKNNENIQECEKIEIFENIGDLRNFIQVLRTKDFIPINFQSISNSLWIDYEAFKLLVKLQSNIYNELDLIKNTGKENEKTIQEYLKFSNSIQMQQIYEILYKKNQIINKNSSQLNSNNDSTQKQNEQEIYVQNYKGCYFEQQIEKNNLNYIDIMFYELFCLIDYSLSQDCSQLEYYLQKLVELFKVNLLAIENSRNIKFKQRDKLEMQITILGVFQFLFKILKSTKLKLRENSRDNSLESSGLKSQILQKNGEGSFQDNLNSQKNISSNYIDFLSQKQVIEEKIGEIGVFTVLICNHLNQQYDQHIYEDKGSMFVSDNWEYAFLENQQLIKFLEKKNQIQWAKISISFQEYKYQKSEEIFLQIQNDHKSCQEHRLQFGDKILQEKQRISTEYQQEIKIDKNIQEVKRRNIKEIWKKLWKRLRLFDGPWAHYNFMNRAQNNELFKPEKFEYDQIERNKIYYYKMSKYQTKSQIRPILKINLKDLERVKPFHDFYELHKLQEQKSQRNYKQFNSLQITNNNEIQYQDYQKSVNQIEIPQTQNENLKQIQNESIERISQDKSPDQNQQKNSSNLIREFLLNSDEQLDQQKLKVSQKLEKVSSLENYDKLEKSPGLQIVNNSQKTKFDNLQVVKQSSFMYNNIQDLQPDKIPFYKYMPHSQFGQLSHIVNNSNQIDGEIPALKTNNKSGEKKQTGLKRFFKKMTSRISYTSSGLNDLSSQQIPSQNLIKEISSTSNNQMVSQNVNFNEFDYFKCQWLRSLTISNLEYIMYLNNLGGRSYKDLTQYPVLPWVLNNFQLEKLDLENPKIFRDLSKSMGAMGDQKRIDQFLQKADQIDPFNPKPKYQFGTHYSSPAIIYQYLVRVHPYSRGAWQLQSGKFDIADRLFFSLNETFKNATEEITDVREMIPEFFYIPEVLLNLDKNDYGITQMNQRVHNVILPPWAKDDPYYFITQHRKALESNTISQHLHQWINLIFGYIQKGDLAEKHMNKFYYLTYEDGINLDKIEDTQEVNSLECQIVNFGQCPTQLMTKTSHPKRNVSRDNTNQQYLKLITDLNSNLKTSQGQILKQKKQITDFNFLLMNDNNSVESLNDKMNQKVSFNTHNYAQPYQLKEENQSHLDTQNDLIFQRDQSCNFQSLPMTFIEDGKLILLGGFYDGRLSIFSGETGKLLYSINNHQDTITALAYCKKNRFLVSGIIKNFYFVIQNMIFY
ncbi:Quinonprotein alcohol dehydrogenase-like superfamily [Pseudocohnilembus persalinus]|uniref:Quinonprotein alcohol dehydrogenase-like superfamily n=1 Tax=Pseudocohnilembus persalinus TaxID=266149 RepID=A0A0V0QVG6_PSEPJ|nr:Quinonprotein alcohol dehydrogenase-like superfamily [Pseudocohnilembus persalinus]|eukprot:KRX06058.1 Quinonprotein alcohol dehydrogenase-like superfamily [Pseudocohnilembus persalinus]